MKEKTKLAYLEMIFHEILKSNQIQIEMKNSFQT